MVKPQPEFEKLKGKSIEEKISDKFDYLQLSREERQPDLFDELSRSIEVLLKSKPKAYSEFIEAKQQMDVELANELYRIEEKATNAQDKINEDTIRSDESSIAWWEYREVLEEIIMELMQKYDLLIFQNKKSRVVSPVSNFDNYKEEPEENVEQQPEETPEPKRVPHLSIRKKGV